ncbi:MAG TPA: hypothetical protein PK325_04570 [Cyclobacteriaceae bacterium]|nr:hypothetical protein [Cyclobacteriaceae bacterium]HMV89119.1 hypothetical protein [Cyclobacteriaceae bacterium]HMX00954.1 hypothetical protein [Cyclobacteriaceae bacterium]HMX50003.1 hypothetical protein [Cyclobacteriaceae bacterium]HMY93758.1 hypothetical protein [Cyclobacteriaceae bacterium]
MAYTRHQLDEAWGHEDKSENGPSRKIFLELLARAKKNEKLTFAEAEYLCNALRFTKLDDEGPGDFKICDDYIFRNLYLRYVFDLNGVTPIKKNKTEFTPVAEKRIEVQKLDEFFQDWEKVVERSNHPNQALNYLSKETRSEIKELEKLPEFNQYGFLRRCNHFDYRKKKIVLHSKFIYIKYQEVMSELSEADQTYELNGEQIEFTEYSFIHILFRHYAEIVKQTPNNKSYHIPDFSPDEIVGRLKEIFKRIDESTKFVGQPIHEVNFRFKGVIYRIWINDRIKSVKGKGNVVFNRLETFFPLAEKTELEDLKNNFIELEIDPELSVFTTKPAAGNG